MNMKNPKPKPKHVPNPKDLGEAVDILVLASLDHLDHLKKTMPAEDKYLPEWIDQLDRAVKMVTEETGWTPVASRGRLLDEEVK